MTDAQIKYAHERINSIMYKKRDAVRKSPEIKAAYKAYDELCDAATDPIEVEADALKDRLILGNNDEVLQMIKDYEATLE
jgi:hypothetical protein